MTCSICGGRVTWRGPITNLTHTECESCGRHNCQEVEEEVFMEDAENGLSWDDESITYEVRRAHEDSRIAARDARKAHARALAESRKEPGHE